MKACQRIEIVVESPIASQVIDLLRELGIGGYTMLPEIRGEGDRGERRADELTGDSSNCLFIIACEKPELVEQLTSQVRPLLSRSGGVCLVSEAQWLRH